MIHGAGQELLRNIDAVIGVCGYLFVPGKLSYMVVPYRVARHEIFRGMLGGGYQGEAGKRRGEFFDDFVEYLFLPLSISRELDPFDDGFATGLIIKRTDALSSEAIWGDGPIGGETVMDFSST